MRPLVRILLRGSLRQIRHIAAVPHAEARGLVAEVYAMARREFGVVAPPLALHSPAPEALAASWLLLRETLLAEGCVSRAAKEAVATAVSRANDCPYCVEVHEAKLATLPGADGHEPLADWARRSGDGPAAGAQPLPFDAAQAPEILGTAVVFHYLNRMVRLFLPDSPVPDAAPAAGRGPVMRTVARAMRPDPGTAVPPGASLGLLPAAPLPAGLDWAKATPSVADALARAVASVDAAAERWIPEPVRELLHARLAGYDGTAPGPGRGWLGESTAGLTDRQTPAARLALLVALNPHQITAADVERFRALHPGDRELVELASWAALTAAVRIGTRFTEPVHLDEPVRPSEPVRLSGPVRPSEPGRLGGPTGRTEPVHITEPTHDTEPTGFTEPVRPTATAGP
ncbi:carboxymuconolactone decarboxylase family protein [Streptomyces tirandamycinicus]|uniref:Alkylhydroperoxidase n=1 Tax=Streptomyces tirandamycinicus TaxID=2174846 RepID=A0A2S1T2B9_9ACTN|nr:carboxymuconolactone decarboxylase family protein [Streptomyces tirandamycinicus]AWI32824.1 alkylhydroperoxidase [Streptomyces tirandamycinicus]